jgi:hypothetical protein
MKWFPPHENLPVHKDQVLVVEEKSRIVHLAEYREDNGEFVLRNGDRLIKADVALWTKITPPAGYETWI